MKINLSSTFATRNCSVLVGRLVDLCLTLPKSQGLLPGLFCLKGMTTIAKGLAGVLSDLFRLFDNIGLHFSLFLFYNSVNCRKLTVMQIYFVQYKTKDWPEGTDQFYTYL